MQRLNVKCSLNAHWIGHVVGTSSGRELIDQPQLLLAKRKHAWVCEHAAGNYRVTIFLRRLLKPLLEQHPFFGRQLAKLLPHIIGQYWVQMRSEERRVGKECRSRWSTYQ